MTSASIARIKITKANTTTLRDADDELAIEEPVEIAILYHENGKKILKPVSVTMRTPGNDDELAMGFLFSEGIIHDVKQVCATNVYPLQNQVQVALEEGQ